MNRQLPHQHHTRRLVRPPCSSLRIPNSGSGNDQPKSCCGQWGATTCQHLSPSSTNMENFDTYRNIFRLNDLISLATGNSLHRSLVAEQGIRMNAQLSGKLQIALERRCYNCCSCTRQRSQDGSPTSHSRKMHIDSALRGPSFGKPSQGHTDTEQLWIISTDGTLTEYICITGIDRHLGSDKTNQGILGYGPENNMIRTIWLRFVAKAAVIWNRWIVDSGHPIGSTRSGHHHAGTPET